MMTEFSFTGMWTIPHQKKTQYYYADLNLNELTISFFNSSLMLVWQQWRFKHSIRRHSVSMLFFIHHWTQGSYSRSRTENAPNRRYGWLDWIQFGSGRQICTDCDQNVSLFCFSHGEIFRFSESGSVCRILPRADADGLHESGWIYADQTGSGSVFE